MQSINKNQSSKTDNTTESELQTNEHILKVYSLSLSMSMEGYK